MRQPRCLRAAGSILLLAPAACVPDFAPVEKLTRATDGGAEAIETIDSPGSSEIEEAVDAPPDLLTPRDANRDVCDLTGGWIVSERMLMNALGAKQEVFQWRFVELEQDGDRVRVTKSLICGDSVKGLPPVIITMDSSKMWGALLTRGTMVGRAGTSRAADDGCDIAFERTVEVRGATEATYVDLAVPLPTASRKGSADEAGWEDWDADGNPGVSVRISGSIAGTLYMASRSWTEWSGPADPSAGTFSLGLKWWQERSVLGVAGSPLLTVQGGGPDPDPTQHLATFTFTSADVLGSSDQARCARIRELAPKLANGR